MSTERGKNRELVKKDVGSKKRFLELLKKYSWNKAVRLLKEERRKAERGDGISDEYAKNGYRD